MGRPVRHTPEGYHTVTVGLVVPHAAEAIEFYRKGLGARESFRLYSFDGRRVLHAELVLGDTTFFVMDENPDMVSRAPKNLGAGSAYLHVYVPDADGVFRRAVAAGARAVQPPTDMFFGDRCARVVDPFGHEWMIATHQEDLSPREKQRRLDAQSL